MLHLWSLTYLSLPGSMGVLVWFGSIECPSEIAGTPFSCWTIQHQIPVFRQTTRIDTFRLTVMPPIWYGTGLAEIRFREVLGRVSSLRWAGLSIRVSQDSLRVPAASIN